MIPTWLIATLCAATLQVTRTALQQRLRGSLTPNGAGFVRYAFGAPWSVGAVMFMLATGTHLPHATARLFWLAGLAGVAQIIGTNCLIRSFTLRDFLIGTAYSKTETLQAGLLSSVVLGEGLRWHGWLGLAVSLGGVLVLALRGDISALRRVFGATGDKAMLAGLGAGAGFAVTGVALKSASQSLGMDQPIVRSLMALATMNTIQVVVNGVWLAWKNPAEFGAIRRALPMSTLVGLLSVAGSAGWAIGTTLQRVAVVRTVGQVDLVLAFLIGRFVFHEQRKASEYLGSALVIVGVILVLL